MTIREKVATQNEKHEASDSRNKALLKILGTSLAAYAIGTIIAIMIERLK